MFNKFPTENFMRNKQLHLVVLQKNFGKIKPTFQAYITMHLNTFINCERFPVLRCLCHDCSRYEL